MSLQCKIPTDMREQLADDPFMQRCIMSVGMFCSGRVQWHHAFTYAGRRINEIWALIPLCEWHHSREGTIRHIIDHFVVRRIKDFRATDDFRAKYPKSTLI